MMEKKNLHHTGKSEQQADTILILPEFQRLRMLFNFESVQNCRLEIVDVDRAHNPDTVDVKNCVSDPLLNDACI